jgi:hypothetical protein
MANLTSVAATVPQDLADRLRTLAGDRWREHQADTAHVAAAIRERAAARGPVHIDKGGVHHVVPRPGDKRFSGARIDLSSLKRILAIDVEAQAALLEPGVTFAELVQRTLPHGLLPTLVPELEGITVGGAVAGCSVESMSHRLGGFHDGCLEYEIIGTDGEIRRISPSSDADAFHRVHGSYGTLATLTALVCRLVPAKPFVRIDYTRYGDARSLLTAMRTRSAAGATFLDAIAHGPDGWILCEGSFVDHCASPSSYRGQEIFWPSTATRDNDTLTTFDYLFRYDTECHWLTRTFPPLTWRPVRRIVGRWFLGSTNLIKWSNRLAPFFAMVKKRPDVVVDVFVPSHNFVEFCDWYARDYKFWPLWIVPYRVPERYPWLTEAHWKKMSADGTDDLMIDCAVYGKVDNDPHSDASEVLEKATHRFDGMKTLISRNHYDSSTFWSIYDKPGYEACKSRLDPAGLFPNVYEKMHR